MHWQLINKSESRFNSFSIEFMVNSKECISLRCSVMFHVLSKLTDYLGHLKEKRVVFYLFRRNISLQQRRIYILSLSFVYQCCYIMCTIS